MTSKTETDQQPSAIVTDTKGTELASSAARYPLWMSEQLFGHRGAPRGKDEGKFRTMPPESMKALSDLFNSQLTDSEKVERFQSMLQAGLPMNARWTSYHQFGMGRSMPMGFKTIIDLAAEASCDPVLFYMIERDATLVENPKSLFAIVAGSSAAVKLLLTQGRSIREALSEDEQLLERIVARAHIDTLRLLVQEGVDLNGNVPSETERNRKMLARAQLHTRAFYAPSGVVIDTAERPARKDIPLILSRALSWGDDSFLNLVAIGCDVSAKVESSGYSVFHVLVTRSTSAPVASRSGEAINGLDGVFTGNGAGRGKQNFDLRLKAALDAGALIDATDNNGQTALHLAAQSGDTKKLESLLHAGADASVADIRGQTALMLAHAAGEEESVRIIQSYLAREAIMRVARAARSEPS